MKKVRILMYNNIGSYPEAAMEDGMSAEAFARDMAFLADNGYQVVSLDEAMQCAEKRERLPERLLALTFDGGYRDTLKTVLPVLNQLGFPAAFFISPKDVGKTLSVGGVKIPCLDWAGIRQLADAGYDIGAYGLSGRIYHPENLKMEDRLISDIHHAAEIFPQKLGMALSYVAVREGVPGSRVLNTLREVGAQGFLTKCPTKRRPNRFCIGRIQIDDDDPNIFRIKISKKYLRFKDSRSWRYIRKYKVDRLAHMISDSVNVRRQRKK